ncbi:hypothetical protein [Streptomyces alanosinicus]|uniref:Uncharacterized protein n=1 Tax=Streptomyces alanosinicus TaxID=68171 RepID=A0A918YFY9_9ACTN|nr:hypothetical protein [Streptomyces alanosinicus]GHE02789.1 hypothetical protein GCM10010339_27350 [Streptomyces alanosinicus]
MSAFSGRPEPRDVPVGAYPRWDEALAAVNRDLAVSAPEQRPLRLIVYPETGDEYVYVALSNGEAHGSSLTEAETAAETLMAVVEAAQDTVTERLWRAWPLCTVHDLGMHPRDIDGRPSWWCAGGARKGDPAHVRATIGELDTVDRARPVTRKRPKARRLR